VNYLKEKPKATGSSLINLTHQKMADEPGTNRVVGWTGIFFIQTKKPIHPGVPPALKNDPFGLADFKFFFGGKFLPLIIKLFEYSAYHKG
jgi:hypothetical protein